ncbi:MAG: rod shape-determining protein [Ruminococcaceae bacterium]|nr:rod shape-determining protein [Oscillospiraceae bacterium]
MFKFNANKIFSKDIGMDLGTASVIVYVDGKGIVLREPSVVAVDTNTDTIAKIGKDAQAMLGRNPDHINVIRPLKDGVISSYDVTQKMIQYYIRRACGNALRQPRVVICVPTGITEVETRAVIDAGTQAGARKTFIVEEPVAAALGAGVDITSPVGHMIVDIGGGTTDVAVISLGGVVVSESKKIAGDKFDEAIMRYVRRKHNITIGERTAEQIKIKIGAVYEHGEAKTMEVKGRCLVQGLPKVVTLSSKEMLEAMMEPISAILDTICSVIEKTPPDLVGDILKHGIIMTGGGSQLYGFDKLIEDVTGIKTRVAKDPVLCVALGTGKLLKVLDGMTGERIDLSKKIKRF